MTTCPTCGTSFEVRVCPSCGASAGLTRRAANQALIKYSYGILAGLLGMLIADHYFPLLDRNRVLPAGVFVLFAPVLFHVISSVRGRLSLDLERLQRAYLVGGAICVSLALVIGGNGALDKTAAMLVTTSIVRKQVVRGRYGPSYTLKVRSWRPGRTTESIDVNARAYGSASLEKPVVLEMHRGVFGLPWYGGVVPE